MKTFLKPLKLFAFLTATLSCLTAFCACELLNGLFSESSLPPSDVAISTDVRLMSFNIRVGEQTTARRAAVVQNIREVDPDVFGVQEADPAWISYLTENLPEYTLVGEGREGGTKGEYAAIFYRTEQYELIQGGTKWLSLTPGTPSILEGGSQYKRVLTYAKLQDKETGGVFAHINAHLDYSSDEIARQQINIVTEYANLFHEYPTFITGDFNQTPDSQTYAEISGSEYIDSAEIADDCHLVATFSGYETNVDLHTRLDYCFVSDGNVSIAKYDTWNKTAANGGHKSFISDHYAIYVDAVAINEEEPSADVETLNETIFQVGDRSYGDASYNLSSPLGVAASFANNTLYLTVAKGKTLSLAGIKTATNVGLHIRGEGSVIFNGDVTVKALATSGKVEVTLNGNLSTNDVTLGDGTTINRS